MYHRPSRLHKARLEPQQSHLGLQTQTVKDEDRTEGQEGFGRFLSLKYTATFLFITVMFSLTCLFLGIGNLLAGARGASDGKLQARANDAKQEALGSGVDGESYRTACPDYRHYSFTPHRPLSLGPLSLPYQRPSPHCRTFLSPLVEDIIEDVTTRMYDKDMARIFENAFPNTLDTTVKWHTDGKRKHGHHKYYQNGAWEGPQSFIVTGDINAEWLRDSTNQLAQYQKLTKKDKKLNDLVLGAINTQAEYVIESPYCNAFQPPPPSGQPVPSNGQDDIVHPAFEPSQVFECKYELDSLAHFLALGNTFHNVTGSTAFLHSRYFLAIDTIMEVLEQQARPTFNATTGKFEKNEYLFMRLARVGSETLSLGGVGNPLGPGTGLIRSAFRPSDDATVFGYLIPANAQMSVELKRTAAILKQAGKEALATKLQERGESIAKGVWEHGVVHHKKYGDVFAFEVDGYGSSILMDDANIPSLLALPLLGFLDRTDKIYQNTRRMVLERAGNPYYLQGKSFEGIGGPHVGPQHAWPMSRLVQAMTSDNDKEILDSLNAVRDVSKLGLINEGVNVQRPTDVTSEFRRHP